MHHMVEQTVGNQEVLLLHTVAEPFLWDKQEVEDIQPFQVLHIVPPFQMLHIVMSPLPYWRDFQEAENNIQMLHIAQFLVYDGGT